jgi:hypothetical protein
MKWKTTTESAGMESVGNRRCEERNMWGHRPRLSAARSRGASFQCPDGVGLILRTDFSAILPIQQIPHRLPPRLIRFRQRLALVGAHTLLFSGSIRLRFAACRTSVGKPRLPRLQLKFLRADHTNFNRKCHLANYFINHRERLTTVSRKQLTCLWRQHREPYKINFS